MVSHLLFTGLHNQVFTIDLPDYIQGADRNTLGNTPLHRHLKQEHNTAIYYTQKLSNPSLYTRPGRLFLR